MSATRSLLTGAFSLLVLLSLSCQRSAPDHTEENEKIVRDLVVDAVVAEGDWVAVRLTFHATHQGEFQGVPATGKAVTYGGAHFGRLVDGKIAEWWILENDLGLMQQIGMELTPAGTEDTGG